MMTELIRWGSGCRHWLRWVMLVALPLSAFPPAPPHQIYGLVRDQIGNPLDGSALIIFEAASGTKIVRDVATQREPAVNYRLDVPLDAGVTSDLYAPTASRPTAPFKLKVQIGKVTYLPMEMKADFSRLGLPGAKTRIDLTLGVDEDGNGLPDAWEKAVAAFLKQKWVLGGVNPNAPYPGTGLTYREVYLAGIYATAPKEGLALQIVTQGDAPPKLVFTAVKGRSYTIQAAGSLNDWVKVPFQVLPSTGDATVDFYQATGTKKVEVIAPLLGDTPALFYRLLVE